MIALEGRGAIIKGKRLGRTYVADEAVIQGPAVTFQSQACSDGWPDDWLTGYGTKTIPLNQVLEIKWFERDGRAG